MTVVEAAGGPGGRAGPASSATATGSTPGPTVLTMPHLVERCFHAAGVEMDDLLRLAPVDPMYRAVFPDGSELRVRQGREAMTEEIRQVCGPADAAAFEDVLRLARRACTGPRCRTSSSATTTARSTCVRPLGPALDLVRLGAFGRLGRAVARRFARRAPAADLQLPGPVRRAGARTRRWPSTPSSPTWTSSTGWSSRSAGCTRSRGRWPRRPRKAGAAFRYDAPVERILLAAGSTGPVRGRAPGRAAR